MKEQLPDTPFVNDCAARWVGVAGRDWVGEAEGGGESESADRRGRRPAEGRGGLMGSCSERGVSAATWQAYWLRQPAAGSLLPLSEPPSHGKQVLGTRSVPGEAFARRGARRDRGEAAVAHERGHQERAPGSGPREQARERDDEVAQHDPARPASKEAAHPGPKRCEHGELEASAPSPLTLHPATAARPRARLATAKEAGTSAVTPDSSGGRR